MRRGSAAAVLVVLLLAAAAAGGSAGAAPRSNAGARAGSGASALPTWLHPTVRATAEVMPAAPFVPNILASGTPAPRRDVTTTVSDGKKLWFGLVTYPHSSQTYPVISADGGSTWSIDGPLFHVDALQGASVVARVGALRPHGAYFWGQGGNLIWITYDLGAHWWQVGFGAGVASVSRSKKGTLEAVAFGSEVHEDHGSALQRFLYASTDAGRTWKLRQELAPLRTG